MTDRFYMKQHDLLPHLRAQLQDEGVAVDLLNATGVTFLMRNRKTGLKISAPMVIAQQESGANPNDTTIIGVVYYRWALGDTDTAGEFNAEFQVNWPDSKPQTFPANNYVTVAIQKDLGG